MEKIFKPKIIDSLKGYTGKQLASDLVAGLIVAIIALPLSIALAIASGVSPEKGIYTAIVAGLVISLLGGSRVNISGPTAAFATIVAGIVSEFGIDGLVIATLMAGTMLILMGLLKFGSLIKYIPTTITVGFTGGIAVTIAVGQIKDFLGLTYPKGTHAVETMEKAEAVIKSITTINWWGLLVGAIALLILIIWPYINKKIPGSLIAVLVGSAIVKIFQLPVNTIGDLYSIGRSLPTFNLPQISFESVSQLIPSAFTIAILAAIESLLSCVVSDGMIGDKHNSNTELIAQGMGNICSGLFGGIPATGAIARTAANVKNGGRSPISGIVHALVLMLILVVLMPYAAWIPMPVIAAILFIVAYNMSEWRSFVKLMKTAPITDILVLIATFILTVVFDLVVAIAVGMVMAVVLFLKSMTDTTTTEAKTTEIMTIYKIKGPMFFASSDKWSDIKPLNESNIIVLDLSVVTFLDASATKNLFAILNRCKNNGLTLMLAGVNEQPLKAMKKAKFVDAIGEENLWPEIEKMPEELHFR